MTLGTHFIHIFVHYVQELWLILAVGFLISGLFYKFIPTALVEEHLGEKGMRPILLASLVGVILPVCCFGTLPIAITFRRKGAGLGAVLAFLVATPATSVSALIVCWKLFGLAFTTYIFFVIILIALTVGWICRGMKIPAGAALAAEDKDTCPHCLSPHEESRELFRNKLKEALAYAFITLPKEIGREIILGIALASFIASFGPIQQFIREFLTGAAGYIFILLAGLLTYVCSTASVPMADALVQSGMSHGQAMCYLLAGPITSYGTMLVIKKEFGWKILAIYLTAIAVMSLLAGIMYDRFVL